MSLKTKIKNDLWRVNYILPFVKKHQFDEKGKLDMIKHVLKAYKNIHVIKSKEGTVGFDTKKLLSKMKVVIDEKSQYVYCIDIQKTISTTGNILSNFTLDYDKIIHGTFDNLSTEAIEMNDVYGREAQAVVDGIRNLLERTIEAIKNSNMKKKKERISDFENILSKPAEHFDEALQRILFFNQIMWQTRHRLNGLGRLDKMLDDLYVADIKNGYISYNIASELVLDFLKQLSKYSSYKSDALEGDIGQIIVLGGLEKDGTYFYNDLTKIFLQQQAKLERPDPKIFLRVCKETPIELLRISVECLLSKTGSPLYSNDDVVIPTLLDFGISPQDAYSYCTSACWEPFIVGKSLDQNNVAVFDFFSALDKVMERKIDSFEDLIANYKKENEKKFGNFLTRLNEMKWANDPFVSMFTDDCNQKRVDISEGSAKYNNYGITTVGISNVIDSFFNIKRLVFDEKRYTLSELNKIRKTNFKGENELYKELYHAKKFYGHDNLEIISLVNELTEGLGLIAKDYSNKFGGTVKFGLSSPGYNILGKKTNADISGRKVGMPYNTHISCLDAAYTEVVGFASKLNYKGQRFNGNVIDFFVAPGFIQENIEKFILFLSGSILSGFFQMQMNIMDSKTLIDAKANPQNYTGLIVRVWGFSAYFNDLPDSYKHLLIERAVAAEKVS